MTRLIVLMLLDIICWSGATFFALQAGYTYAAAGVGALGILVILKELKTIHFVYKCIQIAKQNGDM